MSLHVGTSGYSYKEWKGSFYPEKMPAKQMLRYYGERFWTVEINSTFYGTSPGVGPGGVGGRCPRRIPVRTQGAAADHAHPAAQGRK